MEFIISKVAFLSFGPLAAIVKFLLTKVLIKAIDFGLLELGVAFMRYEVDEQVDKIADIVEEIEDVGGSDELDEQLEDAYRDLIRLKSN